MSRKKHRKSGKTKDAAAAVDWSAVPAIDPDKLETGLYKFSGDGENRAQERISQRELGQVAVFLRPPGKDRWVPVRLWDFTSISFGVILPGEPEAWPAPAGMEGTLSPAEKARPLAATGSPAFSVGDEIEVRIRLSDREQFDVWCQVKNMAPFKEGFRIGLRRQDVSFPQAVEVERRESFRLPLAPTLSLKARIRHPFIFGHWCTLQISDVNRNMGLSFTCLDPAILLFEGMELKIHFELASHRDTPMLARVTWVHATDSNHVKFGAACMDIPWRLHNGLCDFLLYSRQWTPGRLRQAGFLARQVKSRLRFRSVKTMEDYAEVLYLRRAAYVGAGKKSRETRPEEMAGNLDGQSRILMAHHQEKLVGSLTFTFPTSEETVLDSQSGFPGRKYPVQVPPKANLIEVSRLCIDEEYRSTDLLQGLFEHGVKHFLLSDRYWLLTSAVSDLLPLYERIGFRKLGASYKHPGLNNLEHHLILAHRDTFLHGKGMNLLVWNSLFGDMINHLLGSGLIRVSRLERILIRAKSFFAPLSKRLLENRSAQGFRRHLEVLRREAATSRTARNPAPIPDHVPEAASHGAPPTDSPRAAA
jgi:hypothetical protein